MSDDPTDINDDPTKGATEIYYPDSGEAPVEVGLPSEPSTRPDGYAIPSAKTGIPNGVSPSDLPGMQSPNSTTRRTLGQYLQNQTDSNITKIPAIVSTAGAIITPITELDTTAFTKTQNVAFPRAPGTTTSVPGPGITYGPERKCKSSFKKC